MPGESPPMGSDGSGSSSDPLEQAGDLESSECQEEGDVSEEASPLRSVGPPVMVDASPSLLLSPVNKRKGHHCA